MSDEYTRVELMACAASRLLEDHSTVGVGTGLPMIAASLAQRTRAPNLVIMFEAGSIAPRIKRLPISVGDSRCLRRAVMATSLASVMEFAQCGMIDYAFLGGAEIDPFGNLNTTVIGPYEEPRVRLPGSGGANDFASLCWHTIIIMKHDVRKFQPKLNFVTTPGYLWGPGAREEAGLPSNTGPYRVITDLAILDFDEETKRMRLLSVHPGVDVEDVVARTGFDLIIPARVGRTDPPSQEELRILRQEIDPEAIIIGRR